MLICDKKSCKFDSENDIFDLSWNNEPQQSAYFSDAIEMYVVC